MFYLLLVFNITLLARLVYNKTKFSTIIKHSLRVTGSNYFAITELQIVLYLQLEASKFLF